jgi:hypothetical protein
MAQQIFIPMRPELLEARPFLSQNGGSFNGLASSDCRCAYSNPGKQRAILALTCRFRIDSNFVFDNV